MRILSVLLLLVFFLPIISVYAEISGENTQEGQALDAQQQESPLVPPQEEVSSQTSSEYTEPSPPVEVLPEPPVEEVTETPVLDEVTPVTLDSDEKTTGDSESTNTENIPPEEISTQVPENTNEPLNDTTLPVLETIIPAPMDMVPMEDSLLSLTLQENTTTIFPLTDMLTVTLESAESLVTISDEHEVEDTNTLVSTVTDAVTDITDMIVDVVTTVTQVVIDTFDTVSDVAEEVIDTITVSEEPEETSESTIDENIVSLSGEESEVQDALPEKKSTDTSETPSMLVYLDGIPALSQFVMIDIHTLSVTIDPHTVEPGTHQVRVVFTAEGHSFVWEGTCVWGGSVVFTREVAQNTWAFVLQEPDMTTSLWLQTYDGTSFTYEVLDDTFVFAQSGSIATLGDSIVWVATSRDVLLGYNLLSRTFFSQTLEHTDDTQVILDENVYAVSLDHVAPDFVPIVPTYE